MDDTATRIDELLRHAELELDDERRAALLPVLDGIWAAIATVRAVDVGELPPATAFDARWH